MDLHPNAVRKLVSALVGNPKTRKAIISDPRALGLEFGLSPAQIDALELMSLSLVSAVGEIEAVRLVSTIGDSEAVRSADRCSPDYSCAPNTPTTCGPNSTTHCPPNP